jgi:RNA polymerase sigma factor (sigma-70 family)
MLRRDPLADLEPLIKRVYAYVAYRVGDSVDAEDITSATFERALRYRASFDEKRGEPVAWLIGIARREISVHFAGASHADIDAIEIAGSTDLAGEAATRLDLHAAVGALDDRDRELIALRYGADLTARQVAEVLELKTNAVEVALHRALRRLRDRMTAGPPSESSQGPRRAADSYPIQV